MFFLWVAGPPLFFYLFAHYLMSSWYDIPIYSTWKKLKISGFCLRLGTVPETNSKFAPENRPSDFRTFPSFSKHQYSGANLLASFQEGV